MVDADISPSLFGVFMRFYEVKVSYLNITMENGILRHRQ